MADSSHGLVDPSAQVAASAWIGPQCTVEAGAVVGEGYASVPTA